MAERLTRQLVAEKAIVHEASALRMPTTVDRNFELPAALYVGTVAGYFGFLGLMVLAFGMTQPAAHGTSPPPGPATEHDLPG